MGRMILGVVVAIILTSAIFLLVQMIATPFGPQPPKNLEYLSSEEIAAYFRTLPLGAYVTVLLGYIIGTFAGGWIVTKISKQRDNIILPLIVGAFFTLGGIVNFFYMLPGQPMWFVILSLLSYIPFALLGHRFAR